MVSWIQRDKSWLGERVRNNSLPSTVTPKESNDNQKNEVLPGYGVIYHPLRCPRCNSKKIKTYVTKLPVRYHKCKKCKFSFRSIEEDGIESFKKEGLKVVTTL